MTQQTQNINKQVEEVVRKHLPEKKVCDGDDYFKKEGWNQALSQINTSLIADEVLKVVNSIIPHYATGEEEPGATKEQQHDMEQWANGWNACRERIINNLSPNKENENNEKR